MMFDGTRNAFYTLELKTFAGSCSFEREKGDKGIIHYYQIDSLKKFAKYPNVRSGLVLDFRKTSNTFFLPIEQWDGLINSITKKSFNEKDLLEFCKPILINKRKLKVNYRYDIENFLTETGG